ncbi:dTDP-4-dehydrorhamnose 3,5-epimerase or related enzyme [Microbacterium nanhaiense]|uniref:dTDP-4-dehydrorhamnose reductase n=1 Tax=Microbacterium nanhaiense TaxID=1301026 RepID=A0ABQ2N4E5_9MICO|nr:bifunctional dTDP-4-dehydrorhamnose 3,5-epimerase family protein/NAD(P)-dependent oxidoreductase [Microbacterium nanhaiense]GGO66228.1 dTDP-4-dehydrorhamnose 3,5-epimerase or related enzyme [Microbacterium nanhaiense]
METTIDGLLLFDLAVHGDNRGWFKENWQREKMVAAGLPDFGPVQNNISFNATAGTTRGIHAEPWDKWVSVATGRIFGAWVDLREGEGFGRVFTAEIGPDKAIFVPRGVGNAFQVLEDGTAYTYLVNDHWSPDASYSFLNLADETVAIDWPIPLDRAELSEKDRAHPRLADVVPIAPKKVLVLGANGQLGRALRASYDGSAHVEFAGREDLDLTADISSSRRWRDYGVIINAGAYTAVDKAETDRAGAWAANAAGVARLARVAAENGITLVHVSSDYVFDGSANSYDEEAPLAPVGVYGQSKAAGDVAASTAPRHYIVRTSWVIGEGNNFVKTMASLAERGIDPKVVDDQVGRLSFASEIARGIRHLVESAAPFGTYNLTGSGPAVSWYDVARRVFELTGHDPARVSATSTADYFANAQGPIAPRPANSVLALNKLEATGFVPADADASLVEYLRG